MKNKLFYLVVLLAVSFFLYSKSDSKESITKKLDENAVIIDVRTEGEFNSGHIEGAINIPLQTIQSKENYIKELNKPVIFCCASGGRSGRATKMFKEKKYDVVNGGGWTSLKKIITNHSKK